MKKSELVQKLAKRFPHLYQRDLELLVNTVLGEISTALVDGRRVELRGFGAFSIRKRDARKARNPKPARKCKSANVWPSISAPVKNCVNASMMPVILKRTNPL